MSINKAKLKSTKIWQLMTVAIITLACMSFTKADAQPRSIDTFSINSHGQQSTQKASMSNTATPWQSGSDNTSIATWFAKYDQLRDQYRPTQGDKALLTRPLMQQAERVQQWTSTANKVSKNYKQLSKTIRSLTVPVGATDLKEYRDLMADWYSDAADVYRDLVRPRPAAKTIEDLQEQLDAVKKRSEGLANNISNLKNMDRDLRQHYNVQQALQDDVIQQFVRSK